MPENKTLYTKEVVKSNVKNAFEFIEKSFKDDHEHDKDLTDILIKYCKILKKKICRRNKKIKHISDLHKINTQHTIKEVKLPIRSQPVYHNQGSSLKHLNDKNGSQKFCVYDDECKIDLDIEIKDNTKTNANPRTYLDKNKQFKHNIIIPNTNYYFKNNIKILNQNKLADTKPIFNANHINDDTNLSYKLNQQYNKTIDSERKYKVKFINISEKFNEKFNKLNSRQAIFPKANKKNKLDLWYKNTGRRSASKSMVSR